MSVEEFQILTSGLRVAAEQVRAKISPDGMNIGINNEKAAGQAVGHVHWHIIPRWNDDGGTSMHGIVRNGAEVDVKETAKLFI